MFFDQGRRRLESFYFHIVDDKKYWSAFQCVVECELSLGNSGSLVRGWVVEIFVKMSSLSAKVKDRIIRVNCGFSGSCVQLGDRCMHRQCSYGVECLLLSERSSFSSFRRNGKEG